MIEKRYVRTSSSEISTANFFFFTPTNKLRKIKVKVIKEKNYETTNSKKSEVIEVKII